MSVSNQELVELRKDYEVMFPDKTTLEKVDLAIERWAKWCASGEQNNGRTVLEKLAAGELLIRSSGLKQLYTHFSIDIVDQIITDM